MPSKKQFQKTVWKYYETHGRHGLPWRKHRTPYRILVSEIMLQQTQVDRVRPKFKAFVRAWPNVAKLARATLAEVLAVWSGLGYNRRAKFLLEAARMTHADWHGRVPNEYVRLRALPGVGEYTARAVQCFAFNEPVALLETNTRSAVLHHFFPDIEGVPDKEVCAVLESVLDTSCPREWHWALMDYGAHLKQTQPNPSRRSTHHTKQSKFEGSLRQLRGRILRELLHGEMEVDRVLVMAGSDKQRHVVALQSLIDDGLVVRYRQKLTVK